MANEPQQNTELQPESSTPTATPESTGKTKSLVSATIELVQSTGASLFHTPDDEAYATLQVNGHQETWNLKSEYFKKWLQRLVFTRFRRPLNSQAAEEVIETLTGSAFFGGEKHPVHLRVAEYNGDYYLDLANDRWQVVKMTSTGWEVLDTSPVKFRRTKAMAALPTPVRGGSVNTLRQFINLHDEDWGLLLAWIVAALRPQGPYPLLVLHGEQGSAKTTTARFIRELVDPNVAPVRSSPRNEQDLFVGAANNWLVVYDNLSSIAPWLSDALCIFSTGGAYASRQLYSNSEEAILEVQRPVILTGIGELLKREDLMSRAIFINLPVIKNTERKTEAELKQAFDDKKAEILGALLDAMSSALARYPGVTLTEMPRLADFLKWAVAAEEGLGLAPGTMLESYENNVNSTTALAIENSVLIDPVIQLVEESGGKVDLEAAPLLLALKKIVGEDSLKTSNFPRGANVLSTQLNREAQSLRRLGIGYRFEKTSGSNSRKIHHLWKMSADAEEATSEASGHSNNLPELNVTNLPTQPTQVTQTVMPPTACDDGDDSDDLSAYKTRKASIFIDDLEF